MSTWRRATLARIYATVRHFARWLHLKFPDLFPLGCPTEGVKPPAEPTPAWKGLTRLDEIRLTAAAQTLRAWPGHGTNQGLRNHALLAVLLGSGLRVSEALGLDRAQYTGKGFVRVEVKGGIVRDVVPLRRESRTVLDAWLEAREDQAPPSLSRAPVVACPAGKPRQASAALPPGQSAGVGRGAHRGLAACAAPYIPAQARRSERGALRP